MEPKWELKSTKYHKYWSTERFECKMVARMDPGAIRNGKAVVRQNCWEPLAAKMHPEGRQWDPLGVENGMGKHI